MSRNSVEWHTYHLKVKKKRKEKQTNKKSHKPYSSRIQLHLEQFACKQMDWFLGQTNRKTSEKWINKMQSLYDRLLSKKEKVNSQHILYFSNLIAKLYLILTNIRGHIITKPHLSFTARLRLNSKILTFLIPMSHFNFAWRNNKI